jgi:hypothetical protein
MSNFRKIGLTIAVAGATATMVGTVNSAGNNLEVWHSDNTANSNNQGASDCPAIDPAGDAGGVAAACAARGEDGKRSAYNDQGDAAVIPYYTTVGSFVTGMHVVNTTAVTQAVKIRLRRATDSADALDFNVVLSPADVWAGAIHADADGNVVVSTSDTSCTVPNAAADASGNKTFNMPDSTDAREGYVEIIGMGQAAQTQAIAINAKHAKGTPKDCATVEKNFARNMNTDSNNAVTTTRRYCGDDTSKVTGGYGMCDFDESADGVTGGTITSWTDTDDEALKVSWFVRDTARSLEFGGSASHISRFADSPMMTNQASIVTQDGSIQFDPLNFELPNLDGGPWGAGTTIADGSATADSVCETRDNTTVTANGGVGLGALCSDSIITAAQAALFGRFEKLRANNLWGKEAIKNEWAAVSSDTRTVTTDWIVTLPGQYLMTDWRPKPVSSTAADSSADDLPLTYTMTMYDREETSETSEVTTCTVGGITVSPAVDDCASASAPAAKSLSNEVNVITFGGSAHDAGSGAGKGVLSSNVQIANWALAGAESGWATMALTASTTDQEMFYPSPTGQNTVSGAGATITQNTRAPIVGFAVWERNITADASMNFGRAIDHSYGQSSGGW